MKTEINQAAIRRIEITENEIREAKKLLKQEKTVFERIKTIEDAFNEVGEDYEDFMEKYNNVPQHILAEMQLERIVEALNEDKAECWIDWSNSGQYKYYPLMNMGGRSGSEFSYNLYYYSDANSLVSSRLCLKSKELIIYATKQFLPIYKIYFKK